MRNFTLFVCLTVFGAFHAGSAAEPVSEKISQAVRAKLPVYDPEVRRKAEQEREATERTAQEKSDSPTTAVVASERTTPSGVVQLEPFFVRQKRVKERPKPLPRIEVAAPVNEGVDTSDPLLSPEERMRRIRKKWGSPANFFLLNWLFGSGEDVGAEKRERYAGQLGELAQAIELAAATGASPEEIKQLREYYLQLYQARPK